MIIAMFQNNHRTYWVSSYALHKIPWTMAQSLGLLCTVQKRLLWSRQHWLEGKHFCYKKKSILFCATEWGSRTEKCAVRRWLLEFWQLHTAFVAHRKWWIASKEAAINRINQIL